MEVSVKTEAALQSHDDKRTETKVQSVLHRLAANGWMIQPSSQAEFISCVQQVREGEVSVGEFIKSCEPLLTLIPGLDAGLACFDVLKDVGEEVKQSEESNAIRSRFLSTIETAQTLEPESIKIVAAVKEVIENAIDDTNITYIRAEAMSIRDFLLEDIIPFLKEAGKRQQPPSSDIVRQRKAELRLKLETQKKHTNVHLLQCESGIEAIKDGGNYYIKTNHMPRYATSSALEILLRAYLILLSDLDSEDDYVSAQAAREQLEAVAHTRKKTMEDLLRKYATERAKLIGAVRRDDSLGFYGIYRYYVHDNGSANDILCPKTALGNIAERFVKSVEGPDVTMKVRDDGSVRYQCESSNSNNPPSSMPGKVLLSTAIRDVGSLLAPNGVVWGTHFKPDVERIDSIVAGLLADRQENLLSEATANLSVADSAVTPLKTRRLPKTTSLIGINLASLGESIPHSQLANGKPMYHVLYTFCGTKRVAQYTDEWLAVVIDRKSYKLSEAEHYRCELVTDLGDCEWIEASNGHIPDGAVAFAVDDPGTPVSAQYLGPCYLAKVDVEYVDGFKTTKPAHLYWEGSRESPVFKHALFVHNDELYQTPHYKVLCLSGANA
ncbi:hypothetical protein V8C35DRAFT_316357 [Trichoderma chlorosporum]